MKYALAKQLKIAGFPQFGAGYYTNEDSTVITFGLNGFKQLSDIGGMELVYYPTLKELIRACGNNFGGLFKSNGGLWYATMCEEDDAEIPIDRFMGTSEEVAVANLWLKIKENGNDQAKESI